MTTTTAAVFLRGRFRRYQVESPRRTGTTSASSPLDRLHGEEQKLLPVDCSRIPSSTSLCSVKGDVSPRAGVEWASSPTASVTVLKTEVSRLERRNEEVERSLKRARHQIEEREIFVVGLQKQLKNLESQLSKKEEYLTELEGQKCDSQEGLKESVRKVKAKDSQIEDLRHQLDIKEEEKFEYEKELQRQRSLVETKNSEISMLKDEYYQLQKEIQSELAKYHFSDSEQQRLADLVETLKKENAKLKQQQDSAKLENISSHGAPKTFDGDCNTMRALLTETTPTVKSDPENDITSYSTNHLARPIPPKERAISNTELLLKWDCLEKEPVTTQSSSHYLMHAPYSTEQSIKDVLRTTNQLESKLMELSHERNALQSEYAKMPAHAGRTLAARSRKKEVEGRLDTINEEMSRIRLKLKYISGNVPFEFTIKI